MKYNFDTVTNRYNTDCCKYDLASKDLLPMWIADMDVIGCKEITEAINKASKDAIFGYACPMDDYFEYLTKWYQKHFNLSFTKDNCVCVPGVVFALCIAIQAYTKENDSILINEPVYFPFKKSIESNNRKCVSSNLIYKNNKYEFDFNDFEEQIVNNNVKMFVLCSPHNPVGRVWTKEELQTIGNICKKHKVIVFSDEIHSDYTYHPFKHIPFTNIDESFKEFSLIATAPSKTFNIAGLEASNIIILDKTMKEKYNEALECVQIHGFNMLGLVAAKAAYKDGEEWYNEFKEYLHGNLDFLREGLKEIPEVKLIEPEGTYLVWLDFSSLNLNEELDNFIKDKCKLYLNDGRQFSSELGKNFMRMNLATQRANIEEALLRLKKGIEEWKKMNA